MIPIKTDIDPVFVQVVVVLISEVIPEMKVRVKQALDDIGIPSQFVLASTVTKSKGLSLMVNIIKQINAKMGLDVFRLSMPQLKNSMLVGISQVNTRWDTFLGLCSSYNDYATQYYSKAEVYPSKPPMVSDQGSGFFTNEETKSSCHRLSQRELYVSTSSSKLIKTFLKEALKVYQKKNQGVLP